MYVNTMFKEHTLQNTAISSRSVITNKYKGQWNERTTDHLDPSSSLDAIAGLLCQCQSLKSEHEEHMERSQG